MPSSDPSMTTPGDRRRQILKIGLILAFGGLCAWPYVGWARYPSLFDDDLTRVGGLRRATFAASLLRPFNEHLAPLFELVGWFAWWGVGQKVELVATGFLVASYILALATLITLAAVVRLELRSNLAALVAVSLFALSTVSAETVLWYSAGSFQGAAAASLASWFAASKALRSSTAKRRSCWLIVSGLFAFLSPLFSAIGVLAGPLAALRVVMASRSERSRVGSTRSWLQASTFPILGTLVYLLFVAANQDHTAAVSAGVRRHSDIPAALWAAVRAPSLVLIPAMVGVASMSGWWDDHRAAASTAALGVGVLVWAWRGSSNRALIVVGLGWVVGGYLLAYLARAQAGDRWILEVGRYHLFPEVGVICWVSALLGPRLDRLEARRPMAGWVGLLIIAIVGFALEVKPMSNLARRSFRYPDQGRSIAAALRLEAACRAEQVPLEQAIRVIDPIEPRWFPRPLPFNPLLYLFGSGPTLERSGDLEARSRLIARLSLDDREAIFGGLEVAPYQTNLGDAPRRESWIRAEPMGRGVESEIGQGRTFFAEFATSPNEKDVDRIFLEGARPGGKVEVWWSAGDGTWSSGRSVRCVADPKGQVIPLARLPHWRPGFARRFRVVRRGSPFLPTEGLSLSYQVEGK